MTVLSKPAAPRLSRREHYDPKVVAAAFILIAPTIIGLCVLNIYPLVHTIRRSLYKTQGLGPEVYVGLKNFEKLFKDSMIGHATINTLLYMVLTVPVGVLLSLIFAALLNSKIKGRDIHRPEGNRHPGTQLAGGSEHCAAFLCHYRGLVRHWLRPGPDPGRPAKYLKELL